MIPVKEWRDVTIGMWADNVLKLHPNTKWTKQATILIDERSKNKTLPDLIITWHYRGADLVLERATIADPMFGSIQAYAVQKILLKEKPNGHDGQHRKYKGEGRSKKKRKIRR